MTPAQREERLRVAIDTLRAEMDRLEKCALAARDAIAQHMWRASASEYRNAATLAINAGARARRAEHNERTHTEG